MYELNKERFGEFLAEHRRKMGYTQKELAAKLFVSDKAVSKWERGAGMPDISLLIPLADILGVTVTELLEGRRIEKASPMNAEQVENLVKRALTLSEEHPEASRMRKKRHGLIFVTAAAMAFLELLLLLATVYTFQEGVESSLFLFEALSMLFGGYFWVGIKEKLPAYYDENKISAYSDGIFRMNLAGVRLNNSNWPHIVRAGRIWSVGSMVGLPALTLAGRRLAPGFWGSAGPFILLLLFLGGLFLPMYVAAKRYTLTNKVRPPRRGMR